MNSMLYTDPTGKFGVRSTSVPDTPLPLQSSDVPPDTGLVINQTDQISTPPRSVSRRLATHWFWYDSDESELRVLYPSLPWGESIGVRIMGLGEKTVELEYTPGFKRVAGFESLLTSLAVRGLIDAGIVPIVGEVSQSKTSRATVRIPLVSGESQSVVFLAEGDNGAKQPVVSTVDRSGSVTSEPVSRIEFYDSAGNEQKHRKHLDPEVATAITETVADNILDPEQYYLSLGSFAGDVPRTHASEVKRCRRRRLREFLDTVDELVRITRYNQKQ